MKTLISDSNRTINELLTKIYNQDDLSVIEQSDFNYQKLDEVYPVECVRAEGEFYRITYASEEKLLILNYDKTGQMLFHKQVTPIVKKSDLDSIGIGSYVDEVKSLDESGEFYFLYTGSTETPKISTHYTKDGYLFQIEYNNDWKVIDIQCELI